MEFCEYHGIKRQFSIARTPQQNGIVERKNITIHKMARTMLKYSKLNKGILRSNNEKTPYELCKGRLENIKHFRVFGNICYIKREDKKIGKFDSQVDKGILVGYSSKNKAYKC
jgi:transposase InsO family protein